MYVCIISLSDGIEHFKNIVVQARVWTLHRQQSCSFNISLIDSEL